MFKDKAATWVLFYEVFINGCRNHALEHTEVDFGTVAVTIKNKLKQSSKVNEHTGKQRFAIVAESVFFVKFVLLRGL